MKYIDNTDSAAAIEATRLDIAQEQAARHQAATAIACWSSGYTYAEVQLARALPPSPQSHWHDAAQDHFIAWLKAGGFSQPELKHASTLDTATLESRLALPTRQARSAASLHQPDAPCCATAEAALMELSCGGYKTSKP